MHLFLLLLAPILLLAIVALLGFVGCDRVFGIDPIQVQPGITHVQTIVQPGSAGTNRVTVNLSGLKGGELIVATVQWKGSMAGPEMPGFTPNMFSGIAAYIWQGIDIQVFSGMNPDGNTQLSVTVQLLQNSTIPWNVCMTAYSNVDPNTPTYSPQTSPLNYVGTNPQTPPIGLGDGDTLYAVGFAADSTGVFPGSNALASGSGFTAEFPAINNPLVEDLSTSRPTVAQVTNTTTNPNPKGFVFGLGIKVNPGS